MPAKFYSEFDNLLVTWINDGRTAAGRYPSGADIDVSHAAADSCTWSWKGSGPRIGLCFVKCRACGANAQMILSGAIGSIRLACNEMMPGA